MSITDKKINLDNGHLDYLERELEKDVYSQSYYEFYKAAFCQLHPNEQYDDNWHAKYICDLLQEEALRVINKQSREKNIIINVPPRSSKSMIATVIWPCWCWTINPSLKFIRGSYADLLAVDLNRKSKDLIQSSWYQRLYGNKVKLRIDLQGSGYFGNTETGFMFAFGLDGTVTGMGGDFLLLDDLQNPKKASSEVERESAIKRYDETISNRLNQLEIGGRILIMQRLNERDLTGYLMDKKKGRPHLHKHVCIPAEYDEKIVSPPELKEYYKNNLFWGSRFSKKVLSEERSKGELYYAGQFQQRPAPQEGNLVKRNWFKIKNASEVSRNPENEYVMFYLDTAYTEKQENDPSAILAAFKRGTEIFLVTAAEVYKIFPDLLPFVNTFVRINDYSAYGSMIKVEPKASGKSLVQSLQANTDLNIAEIVSELVNGKDKMGRLSAVSPYIQSGRVTLIEGSWNDHFLTQVCSFPNAAHDEFVDLLSYAIDDLLIGGDGTLGG